MNEDPSKLTSFLPLTPDVSSSGFSLSRFFDFGKWKASRIPQLPSTPELERKLSSSSQSSSDVKRSVTEEIVQDGPAAQRRGSCSSPKVEANKTWLSESTFSDSKSLTGKDRLPEVGLVGSEQQQRKEKWRYRNVRTILRRLSALAIDRPWHQSSGDFKHNFKQYWMPDEHCKECYECGDKFNTFRRRHHCRVCGQIFCSRCCNQEVAGKVMGFSGEIRVCNYCHKIVQAYLNDDLEKSIEALNEDMKSCEPNFLYDASCGSASSLSSSKPSYLDDLSRLKRAGSSTSISSMTGPDRSATPVQRSPFDAFGVTPSEATTIKQDYMRELWRQITDPRSDFQLQSHRFRLKTYHNCLVGNELVDWLIAHSMANNRVQAVSVGQALLEYGWIEHVYPTEESVFKDEYMLYQPTKMALYETECAALAAHMLLDSESTDVTVGPEQLVEVYNEDDDETLPNWFRQLNTGPVQVENEPSNISSSPTQGRRYIAGRHLDLDLIASTAFDAQQGDLSLQMNLDSYKEPDADEKQKELCDQASKVSLITQIPPPPLDTYVCVEGHQVVAKRKSQKQPTPGILHEDILHGVVFPRPSSEQIDDSEGTDDQPREDSSGERLAKERLAIARSHHIHALLEQLLKQDNLSHTWVSIILPFVSQVSEQVVPDVRRDDEMDIRKYVWFTKVPGGQKTQCHLVHGVVFTKNVAHKKMITTFTQPKILMMSCAIEYQRIENKMASLDPLVLQEYEFLKNFTNRVIALKPSLLLVEKSVARVAQDMLLAGGITLVHNIKPQVMLNIARCTGADILQSMEQVTRPRLGSCQNFHLQKYTLPNGNSKSLMYFDGCAPDLGCSLVLRGGNEKTLAKLKKVIRYLIYVSYHLKLETKFLMDEYALPPPLDELTPGCKPYDSLQGSEDKAADANQKPAESLSRTVNHDMALMHSKRFSSAENSDAEKFSQALASIILSSSPFCNYSMPFLLTKVGEKSPARRYIPATIYWSRYLVGSVDEPSKLEEDDTDWVENCNVPNPDIAIKSPHAFTEPSLIQYITDPNALSAVLADYRARGGTIQLKMHDEHEMKERRKLYGDTVHKEQETVDITDGREVTQEDQEVRGDEENELDPPPVDIIADPKHDCFDAYNHQKMAVLFSSYSSESNNAPKPCISPWAVYMEFYGRNDITLGGFLERYCFRASYICPSHNCDVAMVNHVRYFAHGQGSLYIHMRNLESPIPGYDRTILTWSWCKNCKQVTPVVPLSFESWSMSFAKYLELRFYASQYTRRASLEPCGHSLHHEHYQYFSFANMVASFKYRAIGLYEVIIPSLDVRIGKTRDSENLARELEVFFKKSDAVMAVILERIYSLRIDDQTGSFTRDARIRDFAAELQKEHSNLLDCIQVLKMKAEALTSRLLPKDANLQGVESETATVAAGIAGKCPQGDAGGESGSTEASLPSDVAVVDLEVVMTDISNKVFHLKKNLCDIVDNWNSKLQDFLHSEKKREKQHVTRSTSPTKAITADTVEYCPVLFDYEPQKPPQSSDTDPIRPKTITQMYPMPVSEVVLTNGTILRQTYLGTTPLSPTAPSPMNQVTAAPANTDAELSEAERFSMATGLSTPARISGVRGPRGDDRDSVGSPYALVSIHRENAAEEDATSPFASSLPVQEGTGGVSSVTPTSEPGGVDGGSIMTPPVGGKLADCQADAVGHRVEESAPLPPSSSRKEVFVKKDEQLFNDAVRSVSTHVRKHLESSSVFSEQGSGKTDGHLQEADPHCAEASLWLGDDKKDASATIPVIYKVSSPTAEYASDEEGSLMVEYSSDHDDLTDAQSTQSIEKESVGMDSELPSEVETTEEMCVSDQEDLIRVGESAIDFRQRRHSAPVESDSDEAADSATSSAQERKKRPAERRRASTNLPGYTEFPQIKEEKFEGIEYLTPKEVKAMQEERRRRNDWLRKVGKSDVPSQESSVAEPVDAGPPMAFHEDHFRKTPSGKLKVSFRSLKARKPKDNPLLKRLVKVSSVDAEVPARTTLVSVPLQKEIPTSAPATVPSGESQVTVTQAPGSAGKVFGHRRMRSAPEFVVHVQDNFEADTTASPYVRVEKVIPPRNRSQSIGADDIDAAKRMLRFGRPPEQLSEMAERICQEDRKDVERDDPEVLLTDDELSAELNQSMSMGNGQDSRIGDKVKDTGTLPGKLDLSSSSETVEDYKSIDMNVPSHKPQGYYRNRSVAAQRLLTSTDESERLLASGEGISMGSRKGERGEKMKKIISQFLPSSNFQAIPRPFPGHEHFMTQEGDGLLIVISEREPTSLIAFCLSSTEYLTQLHKIQDFMSGKVVAPAAVGIIGSQPTTPSPTRKLGAGVPIEPGFHPVVTKVTSSTLGEPAGVSLRQGMQKLPRPRSWAGSTAATTFSEVDSRYLLQSQTINHPLLTTGEHSPKPGSMVPSACEEEGPTNSDDFLDEMDSGKAASQEEKKKPDKQAVDYHIKLQFQSSSANFVCSVYFAEQFKQLREIIFPEGEERYIQSLSRCKFWKATGGKSGSSFSKSHDDRFVMKQMSRLEVQSFVEFAPRYFDYMNRAIKEKRPTAIAKLLGVYRIGFRNSQSNTTMRQDVLVMENLFYEKKVDKIFDLKGSVRSRYVQPAAKDDVLMDENLLEMICESPLFIRPHGKAVLSKAIHNDTEFLSTNMVMDYSLLVGINETTYELVVGIIDYIRTYTWDKKLESYVKSSGILGGQGKMPTVVSPEVYRTRFAEAMQRYFLMVPDKWTGFGADLN